MSAALWYSVSVSLAAGSGMALFWTLLLTAGKVPELDEGRRDIVFHIVSELATAALLVSAGVATIVASHALWPRLISLFAFGALAYTLLNSSGYYADRGDRAVVAMFALLGLLVVPAVMIRLING